MEKNEVSAMMNCQIDDNLNVVNTGGWGITPETFTTNSVTLPYIPPATTSCWHYWQDYYYPQIIRESYPVYIQERAQDKGKQAFEIIKMLKDKRFVKLETVGDFIDCMDALIKIL